MFESQSIGSLEITNVNNMTNKKLSEKVVTIIKSFLELNYSFSRIQKELKQRNLYASKGSISAIKNGIIDGQKPRKKKKKGRKIFKKMDQKKLSSLKRALTLDNPPSQVTLSNRFGVSRSTIQYYIKKFGLKRVKKARVHYLSEAAISKRAKRSWPLYLLLKDKLSQIITTDEKLFHMSDCNQETSHYYKEKGAIQRKLLAHKPCGFGKSLMVWGGICSNGKTELRFVRPGIKINSDYYIEQILKPFLKQDIPKLYPDKNYILQQDSAPSHSSQKTQNFLKSENIKFIPTEKWTPYSPDNSPMDYFVWGYMLNELKFKKAKDIDGFKRHLKTIWKNMPQNFIDKALKSWPRRCRLIYKAKGHQIE